MHHYGLVRICPESAELLWVLFDFSGKIRQHGTLLEGKAPPNELRSAQSITLLAPGQDVRLCTITLPPNSQRKAHKLIPYALEEDLADLPEACHCAFAHPTNNVYPVAIVDHEKMAAWLTLMSHAGLSIQHILPETLALPWQEDEWTVLMSQSTTWVRQGRVMGFCTQTDLLEHTLVHALSSSDPLPKTIRIVTDPDNRVDWPKVMDPHLAAKQIKRHEQALSPSALWAKGYWQNRTIPLNLLQGALRQRQHFTSSLPRLYQWAGGLACLWLFLSVVFNTMQWLDLKKQNNSLDAQLHALYQQATGDDNLRKIPWQQIKRTLGEQGGKKNADFLNHLLHVSQVIKNHRSIQISQITYQNAVLRLQIQTQTFMSLNQFKTALHQQGMNISIEDASRRLGQVHARLVIQG